MIDQPDIDVIDAMQKISKALSDRHHWSVQERRKLKKAVALMMEATNRLDNVEIGPAIAPIWEKVK